MELPKKYDPKEEEPKWQKFWEDNKIFKFNPDAEGEIYSVDTPPPTVSGKMHMGHAFSYAQQDFAIRYKRMRGFNIFYPFGTDDNGLATERLIEKTKGVKSTQMSRKEFVSLCLDTLKEIRKGYIADWRRIAISADFDIYYTTIDEHCQRLSQKSFIDLYKMGREYQKEAPTIWCPECQTAIAQVELKDVEMSSTFNDIVFKVDGKELIIATTRPEMLGACVAIFVHPEDDRYKDLVGKYATVPLYNIEVPILEDEKADPEKGTGVVMCCTFGDQTDIEWWAKHDLPLKVVFNKDGTMNDLSGKYEGMKIKDARRMIIDDLEEAGLLVSKKPITHAVNVHERCGTDVEFLKTKQWFIRYLDLKEQFLEAGKKMNWYPEFMKTRYDHWIQGLQWDWCISRQRHFGVPFPVWYCKKCKSVKLADEGQLPVDPLSDNPKTPCECGCNEFEPEKDVLDTWATSSLTPNLAVELIDHPIKDRLYPMNLRPQAHDIITFWLFNTVVKSLLHNDVTPWEDIMISGFVLDPNRKKMSKSLGNVVEPQAVIEKYSADALRFWAAGSKLGDDLPYQEKDLTTGEKTITKLWNASKFSLMHLEDYDCSSPKEIKIMDKWILSKLNRMIKVATETFDKYEYARTKAEAEKFFWHTFCDNYLEIVKDRLYNPDKRGEDARLSGQYTLYTTLLSVLKLFAPIMPHITEAIYQLYFAEKEGKKSIHIAEWPAYDPDMENEHAEQTGDIAVEIVSLVRKYKSEQQVSLKTPVTELVIGCADDVKAKVKHAMDDIKAACTAEKIVFEGDTHMESENLPIKIGLKLGEKPSKS